MRGKEKTGILVEGGGMKCAYSAGVLDVFLDEGISFDYGIGVSAGAANLVSFQGGQRSRNWRFYVLHSQDPRYAGVRNLLRGGSYFNMDYIYRTISNTDGIDPVDYDRLMENPAELYFPVTNAHTGRPEYFSKEQMEKNHYEPIMATCAIPVASHPIEIKGKLYFDGGVSDPLPVRRAFADGCKRLVVVSSKPRDFQMPPQKYRPVYAAALASYPAVVHRLDSRYQLHRRQMALIHRLEKDGRIMVYHPSGDIRMGTYQKDPKTMQALYDNGAADARRRIGEIKEFLKIV